MLRSRRSWVRKAAGIYGAFIQGIPTLVLLLIMFYVVFANAGLSGTFVAIVTFALCFAWSSGSIFDSAISSVPAGQTEAGLSLGFTPLRTFTGIVFPQALKNGLPLYAGECVALLKSTSIVGYIAIMDLTRASDLIRSRTFDAFIPLLIVTVAYFVLAWLLRLLLNLFLSKK
jgi:polar amino acid transport system substrate-binding protein